MKRIALAAATCATLLSTSAAGWQDEWVKQVRQMLTEAGKEFASAGYTLTHRVYTGSLANGASTSVEVELDGGTEYQLMGACDTDCSDLDLTLFDPAGRQVSTDIQEDDFPIVTVSPARAGTYRVQVNMAACSEEPCRFGIGSFGR